MKPPIWAQLSRVMFDAKLTKTGSIASVTVSNEAEQRWSGQRELAFATPRANAKATARPTGRANAWAEKYLTSLAASSQFKETSLRAEAVALAITCSADVTSQRGGGSQDRQPVGREW